MFTRPTVYDADLMQLVHYQNFPQMLPFIGDHYAKTKLLLVGESHYLPEDSTIQQDDAIWYASNLQSLTDEEVTWTNTREAANNYIELGRAYKSLSIYSNPENAIQIHAVNSKFDFQNKKGIEHLAFYNFFQRPAEVEGGSINATDLDATKVEETLAQIIKVIDPKFIVFTSSKAWDNLSWDFINANPNIKFEVVPHPGCPWWNRVSKKCGGISGKEKFIKFLEDNSIF